MKAGGTYRQAESARGVDENRHLWIVLSDAAAYPDEVITVFLTTRKAKRDQTCILDPGDHPFIVHESTVAFGVAEIRKAFDLDSLLTNGKLVAHDDAKLAMVERIRMLLTFSPYSTPRIIAAANRQAFGQPFP